jgi:hypothetical protein
MDKINRLIAKFQQDPTFQSWGVEINTNMTEMNGQKMAVPKIVHENQPRNFDDYVNRRVKHSQPLRCDSQQWAVIYSAYDSEMVTEFVESTVKAADGL